MNDKQASQKVRAFISNGAKPKFSVITNSTSFTEDLNTTRDPANPGTSTQCSLYSGGHMLAVELLQTRQGCGPDGI